MKMKAQPILKALSIATVILLSFSPAQANDILYIDALRMFASKSTLIIENGKYSSATVKGSNFAIRISFGYGSASKQIGLVYKEGKKEDDDKIVAALAKLNQILNDPKITILRIEHELSKDIGLSFESYVNASNIRPAAAPPAGR
jgi:hypothetical protein